MMNPDPVPCLQGRRILVVEDDFLLALDMEEQLEAAGATVVGPVPSIKDALGLMAIARGLDAAVLDINLGRESVYPLADQLMAQGVIVLFATGHAQSGVPARFGAIPHFGKPIAMNEVAAALRVALAGRQADVLQARRQA